MTMLAKVHRAQKRMRSRLQVQPHATSARFDRRASCFVVTLSNGLELGVPVDLAQGIAGANAADLSEIAISPTGLGLHWPRLDADLYLPALLEGVFGTRRWMTRVVGLGDGCSSSSERKAAASANGGCGGRRQAVIAGNIHPPPFAGTQCAKRNKCEFA